MQNDEDQIREVVSTWMDASRAGDIDTVLSLMTDDVVFLLPGRSPMRKEEFASISKAQTDNAAKIDGKSDIQEIKVSGDWAFIWTRLKITVTPPEGDPIERAGNTLTIFNKIDGRWLLARDANLLTTTPV
jgi:uncharacterized protein (TIGR02246 family)